MSGPCRRSTTNDFRGYIPQRPSSVAAMAPPPLPPRRQPTLAPAGSIYGSPFGGGYGVSPYGADLYGSSYNPSYTYRSPYPSRYGYGGYGGYGAHDPNSPFHSVESIVRTISSLSMMVESTYQSMYMSFRAVLGVAENMDQLRRVVLDLFGSLTLVKTVIWFFKKILYVLGLLKNNPVREKIWEAAAAEVGAGGGPPTSGRRTWPLVAFFGLMLGGPYVLYKLASPPASTTGWDYKTEGGITCVAIHDFDTDGSNGELPFHRGEVLLRQNQTQGEWALAMKKNGQTGYVPVNRLKAVSQYTGPIKPAKPEAPQVPTIPPYDPYSQRAVAPQMRKEVDPVDDSLQVSEAHLSGDQPILTELTEERLEGELNEISRSSTARQSLTSKSSEASVNQPTPGVPTAGFPTDDLV